MNIHTAETDRKVKPFNDIIKSILTGGLILVLPSILSIIILHRYSSSTSQSYNTETVYSGIFLFLYSLLSLITTLIITSISNKNNPAISQPAAAHPAVLKTYLFFSLLTLLAGVIIETLNSYLLNEKPVTRWQQELVSNNSSIPDIALLLCATVIFAPIWEEILFRSYLFQRWHRHFSTAMTIILTSLSWALLHFQQYNPLILCDIFFIGVIFGYCRYKYNSLRLPVFLHMINNLFAFIYMYSYSI